MSKYINADLLKAAMYHEAFEKDSDMQKWDSGCWIRYKLFENIIDNIPTVDVEEVRHGSWKRANDNGWKGIYDNWVCGECGYVNEFSNKKLIDELHFFCPHCGAKMDL